MEVLFWIRTPQPEQVQKTVIKPNEDGKYPEDVWEISIINPFSKERLDYATQKPEALIEKAIKAASNKGFIPLNIQVS